MAPASPPPSKPYDPNPKTPKLRAPPGACDAHFHLFGPADRYPLAAASTYTPPEATPEILVALQAKLGLSRGVVVSGAAYGFDYRRVVDALTAHPDRLRGVVLVPEETTPAEFARLFRLGVRAMRFFSPGRMKHIPTISPRLAAMGAEHGWHVQFYPTGTDIIDRASDLLALNCPVVLDHFASVPAEGGVDQPAFKAVLRMLDSGRVWVKLSGPMRVTAQEPPYANVVPLARALVKYAPERLLWGTDWPHVNMNERVMPNDGDLLDLMLDWVPDEATRNRILAANPAALYGFPAA